jgi:hypothetical protein
MPKEFGSIQHRGKQVDGTLLKKHFPEGSERAGDYHTAELQ